MNGYWTFRVRSKDTVGLSKSPHRHFLVVRILFMWPKSDKGSLPEAFHTCSFSVSRRVISLLLLPAQRTTCWALVSVRVNFSISLCCISLLVLLSHLLLVQKMQTQACNNTTTNTQTIRRKMASAETRQEPNSSQPSSLSAGNCKRHWIPTEMTKGLCSCIEEAVLRFSLPSGGFSSPILSHSHFFSFFYSLSVV